MPRNVPSGFRTVASFHCKWWPKIAASTLYRLLPSFPAFTSRQFYVPLPHRDRRRAEIDEQRAVRAEAARAPGGRRAKLATLQPITCRECGALALAERRLARREPRERRD